LENNLGERERGLKPENYWGGRKEDKKSDLGSSLKKKKTATF
jgi:hypothetical protein